METAEVVHSEVEAHGGGSNYEGPFKPSTYPNLDILSDDLQPADEPSALSLSTRQLLYAVLERALMDLSGKCSEGGQTWKHSAHYVVDAAEWLSDLDSTDPWSFWWVCAHLNLDPGRVQAAIHRSALAYTSTREDA